MAKSRLAEKIKMRCLLVGTPNCGKSTLFNRLTGGKQKIGNWHGKTIECKEGRCAFGNKEIEFVDLPGTYSMKPFSFEEQVAISAMESEKFDAVVQVADACRLERSLFFTLSLARRFSNVIVAINKTDKAEKMGIKIDTGALEREFGIPFVLISAKTGRGLAELFGKIGKMRKKGAARKMGVRRCGGYATAKDRNGARILGEEGGEVRKAIKQDYQRVQRVVSSYVENNKRCDELSKKIDRLLLNPALGFPFFIFAMWLVFQITFVLSSPASDMINEAFVLFGRAASSYLASLGAPDWAGSLLQNGIIAGVGSVMVFVPVIFALFFLLHALEDTGYLARIAVLFDEITSKAGLPGRAVMPLILGFGCNVPAIMSTRILSTKEDRLTTMLAVPFMSCSARFAVFAIFTGAFFSQHQGAVMLVLYLIGVAAGLLSAFAYRKLVLNAPRSEFVLELPDYQVPSWHAVFSQAFLETSVFVKKAGTVILACAVLVWFLASLPENAEYGSEKSYAGMIGGALAPIFAPLGFGNWQASMSLLFGVAAKEVVVGAMAAAYGIDEEGVSAMLAEHFTPLSSLSFMVFVLLYVPCIATISALHRESGSALFAVGAAAYYIAFAWLAAFAVYNIGLAFGY